jgi:hypothetical protein
MGHYKGNEIACQKVYGEGPGRNFPSREKRGHGRSSGVRPASMIADDFRGGVM